LLKELIGRFLAAIDHLSIWCLGRSPGEFFSQKQQWKSKRVDKLIKTNYEKVNFIFIMVRNWFSMRMKDHFKMN